MRTSTFGMGLALLGIVACTTGTATHGSKDTDPTDGVAEDDPARDDPEVAEAPPLASGLSISEIAVFQGVKVSIAKDGVAVATSSRNAPVVANRPALVRVYVEPSAEWKSSSVTAELRLVSASLATQMPIARETKTVSRASRDAEIGTTFNFAIDGENLPADATFQVSLTAEDGVVPEDGTANEARFPTKGGYASLGANVAGKLRVVVVPVAYMGDGSGRTPDVSDEQLERYKQVMMARYPAADVEVTAREPFSWRSTISANGNGFSQVLEAITNLRDEDGADSDVYYYGALAPASSFSAFCQRACVTGLSTVVEDAETDYLRASVGIGYTGDDSASTMAHEVGHAHGRNHAPCGGASGIDRDFPYDDGGIGVWGYDIIAKKLVSPSVGHDMMGYCEDEWVSDYTYAGLFDRIAAVNAGAPARARRSASKNGLDPESALPASVAAHGMEALTAGLVAPKTTLKLVTVAADGTLAWGREVEAISPTGGQLRSVRFIGRNGETVGTETAHFYPYDHLPGGVLVVPRSPMASVAGAANAAAGAKNAPAVEHPWTSIRVDGFDRALKR